MRTPRFDVLSEKWGAMEVGALSDAHFELLGRTGRKLNKKNSMKSPLILFFTRDGDFAGAHVPSGVLEDLPNVQWPRNRRVTMFRV